MCVVSAFSFTEKTFYRITEHIVLTTALSLSIEPLSLDTCLLVCLYGLERSAQHHIVFSYLYPPLKKVCMYVYLCVCVCVCVCMYVYLCVCVCVYVCVFVCVYV